MTGRLAAAVMVVSFAACSRQSTESTSTIPAAAPAAQPGGAEGAPAHVVSGKAPPAVNGMASIIVLTPRAPRDYPPPAEKPAMDQVTLSFTPPVLFVRTGHPTEFRNSDDVLHNVRVRDATTREGVFNVAIITGGTYLHTFDHDGFYDVGCDIHPGMAAQIIASSSPYAVMADLLGNYYFEDVEPGAYTVDIYSGTEKLERTIEVSGPKTEVS